MSALKEILTISLAILISVEIQYNASFSISFENNTECVKATLLFGWCLEYKLTNFDGKFLS